MVRPKEKYPRVILFLTAIIMLDGCHSPKAGQADAIEAKTPVTVVSPLIMDIRETIEFPARTTYLVKNTVRSYITGTIEKIAARQGDRVSKGSLLFVLRTREASALQGSLSGDSSLAFKGDVNVYSPTDGIVSTVFHQGGDFVQEGDELVLLSDPRSLVFILEAPFETSKYVEKTKSCSLTLPDNTVIRGSIRGKLPEMNAQNQTVSYIVNPEIRQQLPENLIASAAVPKNTKTGAIVLPKPAVLGNETLTDFWVMKVLNDSTAVKVPVTKGIETGNEVEITDPEFLPSDRIILTGNYGLPDTVSIIIKK